MSETFSEVEHRHKKEKKDLQGKIQTLKKSSGKMDKKKKKEMFEEILRLETELDNRHSEEIKAFDGNIPIEIDDMDIENGVKNINITQRVSKAQKRRDKKIAEEKAREKMIQEQEVENINGPRNMENKTLKKMLKDKGLALFMIPSNGDCLYGAVSHQLAETGRPDLSVTDLRKMTSDQIRAEKDRFMPFMSSPETGDMLTDEEFEHYCLQVASTTAWGGQVELQALAAALRCPVHVLQASAPELVAQGDEYSGSPLIVTYHRFMYGLGEHYNSTQALREDTDEEEEDIRTNT